MKADIMSKEAVSKGAGRYVVGHAERFDQKNEMYKRPISAEKCLAFWAAQGASCANCIRVCPFNKPSGRLHSAVRWGVKNTRWMDPLFVKMDDLLGYGKQAKAEHFWGQ